MTPTDELIGRILEREGGVKDIGDGKGVTCWGQTSAWLAQFQFAAPTNANEAASNYQRWLTITRLDQIIGATADDLADIVIDIGVMSSAPKAIKALQAALHVTADGVWGKATQDALDVEHREQLAREVIAWDMAYQGRLITMQPSRAEYAGGWANRMADHVRRLK